MRLSSLGTSNEQAAHMGDIKYAGGTAHCLHLGQDAGILHRHIPSAEGHHACAQVQMGLMQTGSEVQMGQSLPSLYAGKYPADFIAPPKKRVPGNARMITATGSRRKAQLVRQSSTEILDNVHICF